MGLGCDKILSLSTIRICLGEKGRVELFSENRRSNILEAINIVQCSVTKNKHSEMDVEKRLRLVCNFCNAILPSKKEATKDAFIRHLEESHNIVQNADDVLILHCLSDEDKSTLKKKKRAPLEDSLCT